LPLFVLACQVLWLLMLVRAWIKMFLKPLALWFSKLRCFLSLEMPFQPQLYRRKASSALLAHGSEAFATRRCSTSAGLWFDGYGFTGFAP